MKEKSMTERFVAFLKDNSCYYQYVVATALNKSLTLRQVMKMEHLKGLSTDGRGYINNAFTWSATEQGHYYWGKLNDKWSALRKTFAVKELTVAEISEKLGYEIKVVK